MTALARPGERSRQWPKEPASVAVAVAGGGDAPGPHARRAELILLLITAAWGVTFPVTRDALADATPLAFIALRFGIAALLLAPLLRGLLRITDRRAVRAGLLLGALFAAGFGLQAMGLAITTASKSAFVTGTCVLFVPVFSWLFERRRPPGTSLAGCLLAAAGLGLLVRPENMSFNLGDLLTLGCAAVFGLEVVALQIFSRRHGPWPLMWPAIAATAAITGLLSVLEPARVDWTPRLLRGLGFTAVVATAGALVLHMRWQKETTAVRAGLIYATEPVFALLFAGALLGERLPPASLAGAAVIVAGVLVAELGKPQVGSKPERGNQAGSRQQPNP
jgi:drug/metabolite transporter (DMT)-like permease